MSEGKAFPKLWATVTIAVAIIGGICATVAAIIGILPDITRPETSTVTPPTYLVTSPSLTMEQVVSPTPSIQPQPTVEEIEVQPTETPIVDEPTVTATSVVQQLPSSRTLIGDWEQYGDRPPMPPPADIGQVIFANGDIDNSGTCHVKEFGPGELVEGLGDGTFQLWLITGTAEQIASHEARIQQGAADDLNNPTSTCPYLP